MATLRYTQVKSTPGGTIRYIANKHKIVSAESAYSVLNYMGDPESTERVYSFARHCSSNPDLAEKMISLNRLRYFNSKEGRVQGLKEGKEELLGLHMFMSYSEDDRPSEYVMNKIARRIAMHEKLRDFPVFCANHHDRKHLHTHFFISAYSAEGKPRKLCMSKKDFNEIRRYANKLCVEHGLSIIDLSALRYKNPEYSAWVDSVIAEGKVTVHPEKEEHKRRPKQKILTRNLYYKWQQEDAERAETEGKLLTESQRNWKTFEEKYFYTVDGDKNRRWYVSGDPRQRFYTVSRVSPNGYIRSDVELAVRFVLFIAENEGKFVKKHDPHLWLEYHAKVDKRLQGMYDYIATASIMNIDKAEQICDRLEDVGKQMNALRREHTRHERSIEKQEQIIDAYQTYIRVRPSVEGLEEPEAADLSEYKKAYAILAQNQILTAESYKELCKRRDFEKQKMIDYEKRMPELKKQYHDLKKLEALAVYPAKYLREIYCYSQMAQEHAVEGDGSVDGIIRSARSRTVEKDASPRKEKNIEER